VAGGESLARVPTLERFLGCPSGVNEISVARFFVHGTKEFEALEPLCLRHLTRALSEPFFDLISALRGNLDGVNDYV
jgi:hypothetical protein